MLRPLHDLSMKRLLFATSFCLASMAFAAQEPPVPPPAPLPPGQLVPIQKPVAAVPSAAPVAARPNPLVWDAMVKEVTTKPLQTTNLFIFWVTNTATTNVVLDHIQPSCGCTVAKLPKDPWNMAPGESGPISATVSFPGKSGALEKLLTVYSSEGQQTLRLKLNIPFNPTEASRQQNMMKSIADKQAVFKGDCASCHVEKGRGKSGEELFAADCTICHQPDGHRAEMVPNLANINKVTNKEYWKYYLENGGTSLMPVFLNTKGGPLTAEEIDTFADFLNKKFPSKDPSQIKPVSAR
jgi:mono/diheme cytochrome c family protein